MFVRMLNFVSGAAVPAILCGSLLAQCTGKLDQRFGDTGGILVSDLKIYGTASLSSQQIRRIASTLVGHCFNEDNNELKERLRNEFQNRGYFQVGVQSLDVKVVDALLTPKLVVLAFAANEGPPTKRERSRSWTTMRSRLPNSAKDFGSSGVIGSTEKKLGRAWQVLSDCTGLPLIWIPGPCQTRSSDRRTQSI